MAVKTWTLGSLALYFNAVSAYYCDSDKCSDDEYCCGYNLCCKSYKVWDLWYFWCGLLFFVFLLSMCGCIWRLRSRSSLLIGRYTYTRLQPDPTYIHNLLCVPKLNILGIIQNVYSDSLIPPGNNLPAGGPPMVSQGPAPFSGSSGHPPPPPPPFLYPKDLHSKSPSPPPAYAQVAAQKETHHY